MHFHRMILPVGLLVTSAAVGLGLGCQTTAGGASAAGPAAPPAGSEGDSTSAPGGDHAALNAEMKAAGVGAKDRSGVIKVLDRDFTKWDKHVTETCGVSIAVGVEFAQFIDKTPDVPQAMYSCVNTLEGIRNICSENDVFKAEVGEKIKRVRCWYHESEEFARTSLASFALEDGTLRMGFGGKTPTNIMSSTEKFLRNNL